MMEHIVVQLHISCLWEGIFAAVHEQMFRPAVVATTGTRTRRRRSPRVRVMRTVMPRALRAMSQRRKGRRKMMTRWSG
jgi:hypothetical protein